jgi:hypothetical protein
LSHRRFGLLSGLLRGLLCHHGLLLLALHRLLRARESEAFVSQVCLIRVILVTRITTAAFGDVGSWSYVFRAPA